MPSLLMSDKVAPIPGVFMKKLPFVALQTNETRGVEKESSTKEVQKKKDKKKLRHEKWLQSKQAITSK